MSETNELTFSQALTEAILSMPNPVLDMTNAHFGNRYASLRSILAATRPALNAQGLVDSITEAEPGLWLLIVRRGEEWMEVARLYQDSAQGVQALGSLSSYMGRYLRQLAYGIVADEGDDGEAAQEDAKKADHLQPLRDILPRWAKAKDLSVKDASLQAAAMMGAPTVQQLRPDQVGELVKRMEADLES